MSNHLKDLARSFNDGKPRGLVSVCSAHPIVLRATIRHGLQYHLPVLIEATCNQVNQYGGYTGKKPIDFVNMVQTICLEEGLPLHKLILGGDHLGPNPWKSLNHEEAMAEASKLVKDFILAGFSKIHIDTSMGCKGEPKTIEAGLSAIRTTTLLEVAEKTALENNLPLPYYIIGTEVPTPGGANQELIDVSPTTPSQAKQTIHTHILHIKNKGYANAIKRIIGLVVQPGIEFGSKNIIHYNRRKVLKLKNILSDYPTLVFEAHSTDYQCTNKLNELVKDGFLILKVGPVLTFSLREALYGLDLIASELISSYGYRPLYETMEGLMLSNPTHINNYYFGTAAEKQYLRHYSLSDRIRYYWNSEAAIIAVRNLINVIYGQKIPRALFKRYLPVANKFANRPLEPNDLLIYSVSEKLKLYSKACNVIS